MAADAEAAARPRAGGVPYRPGPKPVRQMCVHINPDAHDLLREICEARGMTQRQGIERAIVLLGVDHLGLWGPAPVEDEPWRPGGADGRTSA